MVSTDRTILTLHCPPGMPPPREREEELITAERECKCRCQCGLQGMGFSAPYLTFLNLLW